MHQDNLNDDLGQLPWGLDALNKKFEASRQYQAAHAKTRQSWINKNTYYYENLKRLLQFIVEPGKRVLNIRCQTGWFLNALRPSKGVGVEISSEMVKVARKLYPKFDYYQSNIQSLDIDETFDYILFNNVEDTVDILPVLNRLKLFCTPNTQLLIYSYNDLWEPILKAAEYLGLKWPTQDPNWLSEPDICNALYLAGYEYLKSYPIILSPVYIPVISSFLNKFLGRLPFLERLCLANVVVARPLCPAPNPESISVSVVIPCKNEKGNIKHAVSRIPKMGKHTEIIFCDDQSTDGTAEEVLRLQKVNPDRDINLVFGPGVCKADNVWAGFEKAKGDVLMILDGDLAVLPEELSLFFKAIVENKGSFINGSRLVYPIPRLAMKYANMVGNKAFSWAFSFLLGQRIKDTLCGTKVIWRHDWERIKPYIGTWGSKDLWGDYELLFGAAKLNLRIVDLPVHYQERTYGTTKMVKVFWNGLNMLRFYVSGLLKLKGGY